MSDFRTLQNQTRTDAEIIAEDERRIEIRYLKHLKRKYPLEDRRITVELNQAKRGLQNPLAKP
jgi:hypothetical protein